MSKCNINCFTLTNNLSLYMVDPYTYTENQGLKIKWIMRERVDKEMDGQTDIITKHIICLLIDDYKFFVYY